MSIWNKVLTGLIIATSLVFFFFVLRVLKTHSVWRASIAAHEEALTKVAQQQQTLEYGDAESGAKGVRQARMDLYRVNVGRGRVWRNTQPLNVDQGTGAVSVLPQLPAPHNDALKTQLFLFRQADNQNPGTYLGDFTVTAIDNRGWQLQPTRAMFPRELARLQQARQGQALWVMYEKMPVVDPAISAEVVKASLPAGAAAGAKPDLPAHLAEQSDYRQLFDDYYAKRSQLQDRIDSTTNDLKAASDSLAAAQQEVEELKTDVKKYTAELAETTRQRDEVAKHLQKVTDKLAELETAVQALTQWNQAAAAEIARMQLEAARRIDERTKRMAQTSAGP